MVKDTIFLFPIVTEITFLLKKNKKAKLLKKDSFGFLKQVAKNLRWGEL